MQGFIILAIIGTKKISVTEVEKMDEMPDGWTDGWTEIQNYISHPAISRCDNNT